MTSKREVLSAEFHDPEARRDYAELFGDSSIALQIKVLRLQRGLSQKELAERTGMKQSRISAMEQADYSSWSIKTLRRLAEAFDLALVVRFESFGVLLDSALSSTRKSLERPSFKDDPAFHPLKQDSSVPKDEGSVEYRVEPAALSSRFAALNVSSVGVRHG